MFKIDEYEDDAVDGYAREKAEDNYRRLDALERENKRLRESLNMLVERISALEKKKYLTEG